MGEFNQTKFRELILYIATKSKDDPRFGVVKLNKLLYYSDFNAYRRLGEPITHATYQKLREGPAPREMLIERSIMKGEGEITIVHRPYFNHVQQRIVSLRPFNNVFTDEELEIVDEAIEFMRMMSGREASDYSHQELGWELATELEEIPYETAWLNSEPIPQEVEDYARKLAERSG